MIDPLQQLDEWMGDNDWVSTSNAERFFETKGYKQDEIHEIINSLNGTNGFSRKIVFSKGKDIIISDTISRKKPGIVKLPPDQNPNRKG